MKKIAIRLLLRVLNSRWLNQSPCGYGYINNVEAFSIENLRSEERQRPGITVATIIREAEAFKMCPLRENGLTVIGADGTLQEATVWDLHELRQMSIAPKDRP